jgi:hypothetical protein
MASISDVKAFAEDLRKRYFLGLRFKIQRWLANIPNCTFFGSVIKADGKETVPACLTVLREDISKVCAVFAGCGDSGILVPQHASPDIKLCTRKLVSDRCG